MSKRTRHNPIFQRIVDVNNPHHNIDKQEDTFDECDVSLEQTSRPDEETDAHMENRSYLTIDDVDTEIETRVDRHDSNDVIPPIRCERSQNVAVTILFGFFSTTLACILFFFVTECVIYFLNGKTIVSLDARISSFERYRVEYHMWSPRVTFFMIPVVFIFYYSSFYIALYVFRNNLKILFHYVILAKTIPKPQNTKRFTRDTIIKIFSATDNNLFEYGGEYELKKNERRVDKNGVNDYYNNDPISDSDNNNWRYKSIGGIRVLEKDEQTFDCYRCLNVVDLEESLSRYNVDLGELCHNLKWGCIFGIASFTQYAFIKSIVYVVFGASWNTDSRNGFRVTEYVYFGYPDVFILVYFLVVTPCLSVLIQRLYINIVSHMYSKYM